MTTLLFEIGIVCTIPRRKKPQQWPPARSLVVTAREKKKMTTTIAPPLARGIRLLDAALLLNRLTARVGAELRHRRAMRHLRQLDDRMLADIGISRGDTFLAAHEVRTRRL